MRIDSPIITGSFSVNGDSLLDLNTLTTTTTPVGKSSPHTGRVLRPPSTNTTGWGA